MKRSKKILVTGAAGFVGGWLVEALWLYGCKDVRAGIRQWSSAARVARFPVDIVLCDIMDPAQIARAMDGATVVVHCAYNDTREGIIQGTKNMLEVAQKQGVERFVYLSTAEVYGGAEGIIDETCPYQATKSDYATSKVAAEKLCWEFHQKGLPVTVLRPSVVYGPFGDSWTVDLATRLQSGNWGTFAEFGHGNCNLVYIEDLVSAVRLAIEHENAVGEAFNVNGPDKVSWNEYFQRFNQALGLAPLDTLSPRRTRLDFAVKDRVRSVTGYLLKRYGETIMNIYMEVGIARRVMKRVKSSLSTSPSGAELQHLYSREAYYTASKAQRLLGYTPKFNLDTGLRNCALWLDHRERTAQPHPTNAVVADAPSQADTQRTVPYRLEPHDSLRQ